MNYDNRVLEYALILKYKPVKKMTGWLKSSSHIAECRGNTITTPRGGEYR